MVMASGDVPATPVGMNSWSTRWVQRETPACRSWGSCWVPRDGQQPPTPAPGTRTVLLGQDSVAAITTLLRNGSPHDSGAGWLPVSQEWRGVALVVWEGSTGLLRLPPALQLAPQGDTAANAGVTPVAASALPISTARLEKHRGFLHPAAAHKPSAPCPGDGNL